MKLIYILIGISLLVLGYPYLLGMVPDGNDTKAEYQRKSAISQKEGANKNEGILDPNQLWEKRHGVKSNVAGGESSTTEVVPQKVLDIEAGIRGSGSSNGAYFDIPPIDPDYPDESASIKILPPTEPEMDVIPEELEKLESLEYTLSEPTTEHDIPMLHDAEDFLQPNELPPEPAEIEISLEP